jgi:predicted RNA-binding protein YlxR (DUF448 family)
LEAGLGGKAADREGPERTCAVTSQKGPPETMIHFCLSPEGLVVPDLRRKLPGRGVWVLAQRAIVDQAAQRQVFSRGFKTKAVVEPGLAELVERLLEDEALQFLSIVNKAGLVSAGAFKAEEAIRAGSVVALIHAREASNHGVVKLERLVKSRLGPEAQRVARINLFSSRQLDLALGRTNVIHAALREGEASAAFLTRARRLGHYRDQDTEIPSEAAQPGEGGAAAAGETIGRASPGAWKGE